MRCAELWRALHDVLVADPAVIRAGNEAVAAAEMADIRRRARALTDQAVACLAQVLAPGENGAGAWTACDIVPDEAAPEDRAFSLALSALRSAGPGRPSLFGLLAQRRRWDWLAIDAAPDAHAAEIAELEFAACVWGLEHIVQGTAPRCRNDKRLQGFFLLQRFGLAIYQTIMSYGVPAVAEALSDARDRDELPCLPAADSAIVSAASITN